jgi:hypothetical protein
LKQTGVEWREFHGFRRGLGTRLYNNETPIETVAKILRHGSGSEVTLKHYAEVEHETKAAALQKLEGLKDLAMDPLLDMMKRHGIPETRENYLALAYLATRLTNGLPSKNWSYYGRSSLIRQRNFKRPT